MHISNLVKFVREQRIAPRQLLVSCILYPFLLHVFKITPWILSLICLHVVPSNSMASSLLLIGSLSLFGSYLANLARGSCLPLQLHSCFSRMLLQFLEFRPLSCMTETHASLPRSGQSSGGCWVLERFSQVHTTLRRMVNLRGHTEHWNSAFAVCWLRGVWMILSGAQCCHMWSLLSITHPMHPHVLLLLSLSLALISSNHWT